MTETTFANFSSSILNGMTGDSLHDYLGELIRLVKDGGPAADRFSKETMLLDLLHISGLDSSISTTPRQRLEGLSRALRLIFSPSAGNSLRSVRPEHVALTCPLLPYQ